MQLTEKFKVITRLKEQFIIIDEKELYSEIYSNKYASYTKLNYSKSSDNKEFKAENRVLLNKFKEIASNREDIQTKLEEIWKYSN